MGPCLNHIVREKPDAVLDAVFPCDASVPGEQSTTGIVTGRWSLINALQYPVNGIHHSFINVF
jgi:hypothetical protein